MFRDNVIWVDFRLSKDIRDNQVTSFSEWIRAKSARPQSHRHASRSALETLKLMLDSQFCNRGPNDKA